MKEYERRQTAKQKAGFQKKQRGWLTRVGRWFSKLVNFGRRHGEPEAAAVPEPQQPAIPQIPVPPAAAPAGNAGANAGAQADQADDLFPDLPGPNYSQNDPDLVVEAPRKKRVGKKKKKK